MKQDILTLNRNWEPHSWISVEDAMKLESKNLIIDRLGESVYIYHGGTNRLLGSRSTLKTNSIIVIDGITIERYAPTPLESILAIGNREKVDEK